MSTTQNVPNPFALMMDPESILAAVARSERLARLKSQICRPLDKPTPPKPGSDLAAAAYDHQLDSSTGGDRFE